MLGYICTSTAEDQAVLTQQQQALLHFGVPAGQVYEDLRCEARGPRPHRDRCLQALQAGDTLVIWQLDRLAHNRGDLLTVLRALAHRQVALRVLAGRGTILSTADISLGTVVGVIEALMEFDELNVREARQQGIDAARERGQAWGRKRKVTADTIRQAMSYMANSDMSIAKIAERLQVPRTSLYTYLNGDGSLKPAGQQLLAIDAVSGAEPLPASEDITSSSINRRNAGE